MIVLLVFNVLAMMGGLGVFRSAYDAKERTDGEKDNLKSVGVGLIILGLINAVAIAAMLLK
jgi:hypothetical protein